MVSVEKSLLGARWLFREPDQQSIDRMVQAYGVPEVVARLLNARHISPENALRYLNPKLSADLPDPSAIAEMDAMAAYVAKAIIEKRGIGIFADFDVDGATSSAIILRFSPLS